MKHLKNIVKTQSMQESGPELEAAQLQPVVELPGGWGGGGCPEAGREGGAAGQCVSL